MRLYNWEQRLSAYITTLAARPFDYGRHDCALFAAGAVEALTGHNPALPWIGRYRTELGGRRLMRRAGFDGHVAGFRSLFPQIRPVDRLHGDLAVLEHGGREIMGVSGGGVIHVLREDGLGLVPASAARDYLAVH